MSKHCAVPSVPIQPSPTVHNLWTYSCGCGHVGTADTPETAVVDLALHLIVKFSREETDERHAFRPAIAADGSPSRICAICGDLGPNCS